MLLFKEAILFTFEKAACNTKIWHKFFTHMKELLKVTLMNV